MTCSDVTSAALTPSVFGLCFLYKHTFPNLMATGVVTRLVVLEISFCLRKCFKGLRLGGILTGSHLRPDRLRDF